MVALDPIRDSIDGQLDAVERSWSAGERERAEGLSRALEDFASRDQAPLERAATLYRLAMRWQRLEQPERAKPLYEQALPLFAAHEGRTAQRGAGFCAASLGQIARAKGFMEAAAACYRQAESYFARAQDQPNQVAALNNAGVALEVSAQYPEAEEVLRLAAQLAPRDPAVLGNLALVAFDRLDFDESRRFYGQAIASDDGNDPHRLASHWGGLGNVYRALAEYPQARECYLRALEISRAHGATKDEEVGLGNLGMVYLALGQFSDAIVTLEKARRLSGEIGAVQDEVDDLLHLSSVYREVGNYEQAGECLRVGLALAQAHELRYEACALLESLGNLHWAVGNRTEAKSCFEQARASSLELGDLHQRSTSILNLGGLALQEGGVGEAIRLFTQALEEARSGNHPVGIAAALLNLGIALSLRNHSRAKTVLLEAIEFSGKHGLPDDLYLGHLSLAELCETGGDSTQAIAHYRQALAFLEEARANLIDESQQWGYLGNKGDPFARLAKLLWQHSDAKAAWATIEQARSRGLLMLLGETTFALPRAQSSDWQAAEDEALARLRGIRIAMREASGGEHAKLLESWLNESKKLKNLWKEAFQVTPEYIALRQGLPINAEGLRVILDTRHDAT